MSELWRVERVAPVQTYTLRRAVLRGGRPEAVVAFPGDEAPGALHLGVWRAPAPEGEPDRGRAPGGVVSDRRGRAVARMEPGSASGTEASARHPHNGEAASLESLVGVATFLPEPPPRGLLALLEPGEMRTAGDVQERGATQPAASVQEPGWARTAGGLQEPGRPGEGPRRSSGSYQLRGMAVAPDWQGSGAGSALLRRGLELVEQESAALVWANGRDPALTFYRRHGFCVLGDGFVGAEGVAHHWIARWLGGPRLAHPDRP